MQQTEMDRVARCAEVHRRLLEVYGQPAWHPDPDAISQLVGTILSQNTNDTNRDVAYARLRERFPTWEQVRDADVREVIQTIRPAGLANQKGPRIQEALRFITAERGALSLGFLADMPVPQAKAWLSSIKGVGPKTAAIVLLFSLDRPAFPVDTHVHRVTRRLGLIGPRVTRERAHHELERLVDPKDYLAFHLNIIQHGRQVCSSRAPRCPVCVLQDICDYYVEAARMNAQELVSKLHWLGHDSFRLDGPPVIYFDPWKLSGRLPKADLVLVSHEHYDHCSPDDVEKVRGPKSVLVANAAAAEKLPGARSVKPGDRLHVVGVDIQAVPAYNLTKFRSPGVPFHPPQAGHVGYIVTVGGVRLYFAGDTDLIPEMNTIQCDVALLPVSGTYVMTVEEAAEAARALHPQIVVPMHYGSGIGTPGDGQRFGVVYGGQVAVLAQE